MRSIIAWLALGLLAMASACSGGDKDSFRNVDHDKNGRLSHEELLFVFPDVTPEEYVRLDIDGDGSLSESEYAAFLKGDAAKGADAQKPAAGTSSQAPARPGDARPLAVPFKGEEVIEIPAPSSEQGARAKAEKGRKDQKDQKDQKAKPEAAKKGEGTQYTVVRGDKLSRIAHKFGVTVEDITRANGDMHPDTLRDGQVLTIPARP